MLVEIKTIQTQRPYLPLIKTEPGPVPVRAYEVRVYVTPERARELELKGTDNKQELR